MTDIEILRELRAKPGAWSWTLANDAIHGDGHDGRRVTLVDRATLWTWVALREGNGVTGQCPDWQSAHAAAMAWHVTGEHLDPINRPSHYTMGGIEVRDAIHAWGLGYNLGNAVKYVARAGKKDPTKTVEDLRKALNSIEDQIARLTPP